MYQSHSGTEGRVRLFVVVPAKLMAPPVPGSRISLVLSHLSVSSRMVDLTAWDPPLSTRSVRMRAAPRSCLGLLWSGSSGQLPLITSGSFKWRPLVRVQLLPGQSSEWVLIVTSVWVCSYPLLLWRAAIMGPMASMRSMWSIVPTACSRRGHQRPLVVPLVL